jgi:hypothetical protein
VAVGLCFSHGAQGSIYLQDGFNYTSGGALAGNGAWVNSYSLITVGSGSLTYFGLADTSPSGNEAAVAANPNVGSSTSPTTFWTASPFSTSVSSGVVYAAFLLDYTAMASGANYTFMGLLPSAGNSSTFSSANDPCDLAEKASGTGYTLGIRATSQTASYAPTVLALNTVNLIVMKYDFAAKTASLFINPSLAAEPAAPSVSSIGTSAAANLAQIYLRAAGNIAGGGGVASPPYIVDSIRVASTWAEVMPQAAVPPAARLGFTTAPSVGAAGAMLADIVVQAQDANTNSVATNNVPITVGLNTGSFGSGTTTVYTDATGKAVFTNLVINSPGTYTLTATASGIGAGLASATSGSFEIVSTNVTAITPQGYALSAFLDSLRVEQYWADLVSVNWLTGAAGGSGPNKTQGTASHCSAFAGAVAELLGVYLLRPPEASDMGLADNQATWLQTNQSAGWFPISSMLAAQSMVNTGALVVASYNDPNTSGHIAILRASMKSNADVLTYGPEECQSGVYNYNDTNVVTGFNQHTGAFPNGIRYYGHALTGSIMPVNPVLGASSLSNGVFCVNATNIVGRKYTFQCTSNFLTWSNVLTYTNSNGGSNFWCVTPLTDSAGAGSAPRFYRLLAQ